jgi:hypothetical protein
MDMNTVKAGAGCLLGGLSQLALSALGIIIHVVTIIIAFKASGLFAAIISAGLPVLAQIYWLYKIWSVSGIFFNIFTIAIIVYLVLWGVFLGACALAASAEK